MTTSGSRPPPFGGKSGMNRKTPSLTQNGNGRNRKVTKLRDRLIEAVAELHGTRGSWQAEADIHKFPAIAEIVDAILTTLADEEPDEAMVFAAIDSGGIRSEGFVAMEEPHAKAVYKGMTAALRDSGGSHD